MLGGQRLERAVDVVLRRAPRSGAARRASPTMPSTSSRWPALPRDREQLEPQRRDPPRATAWIASATSCDSGGGSAAIAAARRVSCGGVVGLELIDRPQREQRGAGTDRSSVAVGAGSVDVEPARAHACRRGATHVKLPPRSSAIASACWIGVARNLVELLLPVVAGRRDLLPQRERVGIARELHVRPVDREQLRRAARDSDRDRSGGAPASGGRRDGASRAAARAERRATRRRARREDQRMRSPSQRNVGQAGAAISHLSIVRAFQRRVEDDEVRDASLVIVSVLPAVAGCRRSPAMQRSPRAGEGRWRCRSRADRDRRHGEER